jgi:hypothetical protein
VEYLSYVTGPLTVAGLRTMEQLSHVTGPLTVSVFRTVEYLSHYMDNIFPLITPIVYPVSQKKIEKIVTIKNMKKEAEIGELEVAFLNIQFIKCEELLLRENHKQEELI